MNFQDQPHTQSGKYINHELIKNGFSLFNGYLNEITAKKNEKKRRPQSMILIRQYSQFNLIKIQRQTLKDNQLIAQQLIKTNIQAERKQKDCQQDFKIYEDFQNTQRVNKKFLRFTLKPILAKYHYSHLESKHKHKNVKDLFEIQMKQMIKDSTENQFTKVVNKHVLKPKLQTKTQMTHQIKGKMLYFRSNMVSHFRKVENYKKMQRLYCNLTSKLYESIKQSHSNQTQQPFSTQFCIKKHLREFHLKFESCLPQYLHFSQLSTSNYPPRDPLWQTSLLQKQLNKLSFKKITGRVLYRFQHNILQLKDTFLKIKIYDLEKKSLDKLKKYFQMRKVQKRKVQERNFGHNNVLKAQKGEAFDKKYRQNMFVDRQKLRDSQNDQIFTPKQIQFQNNQSFRLKEQKIKKGKQSKSKDKKCLQGNLILRKNFQQPAFNNFKSQRAQNNQRNIYFQTQQSVKYNQREDEQIFSNKISYVNNISAFNLKNKPPKSSQYVQNDFGLDKQTYSKNSLFAQHQKQDYHPERFKGQLKHGKGNADLDQHRQGLPERNILFFNKGLISQRNQPSFYQNDSQSSSQGLNNYQYNLQKKFEQGKTTKKKNSFMKTPSFSNPIIMKPIANQYKKSFQSQSQIQLYPIKIGNLIIEKHNKIYLEYFSQKQVLKDFTVKFLIDRLRHKTNSVELIVPKGMLDESKKEVTGLKERHKVKQMIKIVTSLGGQIQKIKASSAFANKTPPTLRAVSHQQASISICAQLSIFKFYNPQLSYHEIINSLNLQNQYIQNQKDNKKIGGQKY